MIYLSDSQFFGNQLGNFPPRIRNSTGSTRLTRVVANSFELFCYVIHCLIYGGELVEGAAMAE